jgi:hypothetical protein
LPASATADDYLIFQVLGEMSGRFGCDFQQIEWINAGSEELPGHHDADEAILRMLHDEIHGAVFN